jgi:hypothetical protein
MSQLFHRSANTLSRVSIFGAAFVAAGLLGVVGLLERSPYVTGVGQPIAQPVPFSHAHHVGDEGFDCRYCHATVESSAFAGLPSTATCMNCHSQIWAASPALAPVRESFRTGEPIVWNRVYDLPDFAFFNHSVHVTAGFGCETCHGRVDQMPLTWKATSLHMEWCLDCHRHPERYIRPREAVFVMGYQPAEPQSRLGPRLVAEHGVAGPTGCSHCHH